MDQPTTFTFTLDAFKIETTRSLRKDTDYVSFTLLVTPHGGKGTPKSLTKAMGDVDNGTHKVDLTFSGVILKPTDSVTLNYLIVNTGSKSKNAVEQALVNSGTALANKELTGAAASLGAAVGTLIPIPGLGTLLGAGAGAAVGWGVGELKGFLTANCDGAVAAEQINMTYPDMVAKTAKGTYSHTTHHPGTDSAKGCGYNSKYDVTWSMMSH